MRGMEEELVDPVFGSPKDYVHQCLPPSTLRSQLPYIDYFAMVADTVPLAESRGFGRKGQRLDRVRQRGWLWANDKR